MFEIKDTYYYNNMAMKKLGRCLLTLALSAPLLSGCSFSSIFSNLPEETKDVLRLDLRGEYAHSVALNSKYNFEGQVYIMYKDETEKEITSYCTFRDVDTSKVGKSELRVDYETKSKIYYTVTSISVYDPNAKSELESISVKDYTNTVEKGAKYTFDGKVYAKYKGVDDLVQVKNSDCVIDNISTDTTGAKSLSISFTDSFVNPSGVQQPVTKNTIIKINVIQKPTAISASALEVGVNRSKQIQLAFTPSDTTEKGVTYVSSNPAVATVDDNGNVTGKTAGQSTSITVTSKVNSSVKTTVNVNVVDFQQDSWTIFIYMCGANLESDYASQNQGAATLDLKEIASVSGKTDDVNIVVQAGGATKWSSTYSHVVSSSYCNRFHLENKNYVKDSQTAKQNMGDPSTLESFLTWGIDKYPADKIGLIFWNHGGAITGACFDDQFPDEDGYGDGLTPDEMVEGIRKAKTATGYSDKFEFIGYDCCLMQFQDLLGLNAPYANYQIASEESEWGYGWSYDKWIDDLYANKPTETILKSIVDGFIEDTDADYYDAYGEQTNQTLSYVNLSNWNEYESAWESMATTLNSAVSSWTTFSNVVKKCGHFGEEYDLYDIGDFCKYMKASSSFKSNTTLMNKIDAVMTAYDKLMVYEDHGVAAGNVTGGTATGIALFAPITGQMTSNYYYKEVTTLQNWRNFCVNKGNWYSNNWW